MKQITTTLNAVLPAFMILIMASFVAGQDPQDPKGGVALSIKLKKGPITVANDRVRLKDVADVSGFARGGNAERNRLVLRARYVQVASLRAKSNGLTITHRDLQTSLVAAGFNLKNIMVAGAEDLEVRRQTLLISPRRIAELANRHIAAALRDIDNHARYRPAKVLRGIELPVSSTRPRLEIRPDPKNEHYLGLVNLQLYANSGQRMQFVGIVPMRVTRTMSVIRAARNIRNGNIVSRDDLKVEKREMSRLSADVYFSTADVVGLIAQVSIERGTLIRRDHLKMPNVIRKGDMVKAQVKFGKLIVETTCRAEKAGAAGDIIELTNLQTGKAVYGKIVNSEYVLVSVRK